MSISTSNLYEEIGPELLNQLVKEFYNRVYQDPAIKHLFENPREEVERKQLCFLTQFLGGPPLYTTQYGPPRMRRRHLPHAIKPSHKEAWLGCMKQAIWTLDLSLELKNRLYETFPVLAQHMVNRPD